MGGTEVSMLTESPFLRALDALRLDPDDFVIFGSGPMLAAGLRDISDLDIVARGASWEWALQFGEPIADDAAHLPRVRFWVGAVEIEIGPKWYSPPLWSTDDLIDGAEKICGYRFASLLDVRRYKLALGRAKDWPDIAAIEDLLNLPRSVR